MSCGDRRHARGHAMLPVRRQHGVLGRAWVQIRHGSLAGGYPQSSGACSYSNFRLCKALAALLMSEEAVMIPSISIIIEANIARRIPARTFLSDRGARSRTSELRSTSLVRTISRADHITRMPIAGCVVEDAAQCGPSSERRIAPPRGPPPLAATSVPQLKYALCGPGSRRSSLRSPRHAFPVRSARYRRS